MLPDPITLTDEEIAKIETPRVVRFWGQDHDVTVKVLRKVIGDGSVLVAFTPLNTRPAYYLCRVGAEWGEDTDRAETMIEEIIDAIEDEFGRVDGCTTCPGDCPGYGGGHVGGTDWPALDLGAGWESEVTTKANEVYYATP